MRSDPDPAALSDGERHILATIEAELDAGDPGFAARYRRRLEVGGSRQAVLAIAAIVAGGVLMVVTFTSSLLLATMGAALMGIGAAVGAPRAEIAARRTTASLGWWVDPDDRSPRSG